MPTPTLVLSCSADRATQAAALALRSRGLEVLQSFRLDAAATEGCDCPHHGTPHCRCQYSVLLVYASAGPPLVLTAHGREDETRVAVVSDPNAPADPDLVQRVVEALEATEFNRWVGCSQASGSGI